MIPLRDDVPARRYPFITVSLIAVNLVFFLYQVALPPAELNQFIGKFGVVPEKFQEPLRFPDYSSLDVWLSILTSMFLHGGWFHLIGNMWYLWIFGDNVEDRMGHLRFLIFYLLCGLIASGAHVLANPSSTLPSIGASGAVAGVLGAYVVSYPFARILTIIPLLLIWPLVYLPAVFVLGAWFVLQLFSGAASIATATQTTAGGIAWWAHVGGFLSGMILVGLFAQRNRRPDSPA